MTIRARGVRRLAVPVVLLAWSASVASAADCHDSTAIHPTKVLCHCGDRVIDRKHLSPADPVTQAPCPGDGLIIAADDVLVDMSGRQITGSGKGVGIRIEPGRSGVRIREGTITGFEVGIRAQASTAGILRDLRVLRNRGTGIELAASDTTLDGILLQHNGGAAVAVHGDMNVLESLTVRDNGAGIAVTGNRNAVLVSRLERNGSVGIAATGEANAITRNVILYSGSDGIRVDGTHTSVHQNQVKFCRGKGIDIEGTAHHVKRNVVQNNAEEGIFSDAVRTAIDRNQAKANKGFGIRDTSAGDGTEGTGATYKLNTCSANTAGESQPPGLCR